MAIDPYSGRSLLIQLMFGDTVLATGTAFVAMPPSGPVIITNRHNFTGRHQQTGRTLSRTGGVPDRVRIFHHKWLTVGTWLAFDEPLFNRDGSQRWFEHPTLGARMDVVALPIRNAADVELMPYELHDFTMGMDLWPASSVSVIGFPFGLGASGAFAIWATGAIASDMELDYDGLPVFLIDCRSRTGQSGSPVVFRGRSFTRPDGNEITVMGTITKLIGVYSGRISPKADLGMVWKLSAVREIVASVTR
jgi:hypothetical protein